MKQSHPGTPFDYSISWINSDSEVSSCYSTGADEQATFEAASLSKLVFATIVIKLIEEEHLNLDDQIIKLFSPAELPPRYNSIYSHPYFELLTVRNILNHSSGLPNWRDGELDFRAKPGETFSYSGEAYELLQFIVENYSGKELEELAADYIFRPLGLKHTSFTSHSVTPISGMNVIGYDLPSSFYTQGSAAYSLLTTSSEYLKFLRALIAGTIISVESLNQMITVQNQEFDGSISIGWGLGLMIDNTVSPVFVSHTGSNPGFRALALVAGNNSSGLVYLSNSENGSALDQHLTHRLTSLPIESNLFAWLECNQCGEKSEFIKAIKDQSFIDHESLPLEEQANIAHMFAEFGEHDLAVNLFDALGEKGLSKIEVLYGKSIAHLRIGEFELAKSYLEQVLNINPNAENARKIHEGLIQPNNDNLIEISLDGYKDARSVFLRADLNNWHRFSLPLRRTDKGWSVLITPTSNEIRYYFQVDNERVVPCSPCAKEFYFGKQVAVLYLRR
ncbi:serine hydrolase [Pseudidiomarina aestuarii]|uniref:serine hydrolase n=1 Tax=Pseudidiomarina aestuarii TaxID=624146 RepID=UPI0014756248|nr:serine hydrolase [Pseudidiomarina aestuarii]